MADNPIDAGLKSLQETLEQIKSLLAWDQLQQSEAKPGQPPGFTRADSLEFDLRNRYSHFMFTLVEIRSMLNDPDKLSVSKAKRDECGRELQKVEAEFRKLDLAERFIRF